MLRVSHLEGSRYLITTWAARGSSKGGIDVDVDVRVDVDIDSCFGCVKGISKSVQVLLNDIEAVMVLSL